MNQRINWRDFAKNIINNEDLIDPEVQHDHPLMKQIAEIVFYNGLSDYEREAGQRHFEKTGIRMPMQAYYKAARGGKPDMSELEDMLFEGLMPDLYYEDYAEMKESNPSISAREFYEKRCAYNEDDPAVKMMAKIFAAILDMPETNDEQTDYISRQEFENMKHDIEWVKRNIKSIEKSRANW